MSRRKQRREKSYLSSVEGSHRGSFMGMGELGGMWGIESVGDGWQRNLKIGSFAARGIPAVYACVQASARAISQCYPHHKIHRDDGGTDISKTSPAARVFRKPNSYETFPQFMQNLVSAMLFDGECFCLIVRDERRAVTALHIMPRGTVTPYVSEDGGIFYNMGGNPMLPNTASYMAPQRDVCHFRTYTPRHPLIGESPIKAASLACGINVALSESQAAFFSQMNRPSGVLSTDSSLNRDQMQTLRAAFDEQSKGWAQGKMPILASGLKFQQLSVNSVDAQLIEAQRMSIEDIARVFGVPLPIVGDLSKATLNNTESLINHWLSLSLGALIENIERSFDDVFGFTGNDFSELDTKALLRLDYSGRIDALTRATQGGLMSPNEARRSEGLPDVDGGDEPFMQAQNTPVSLLAELAAANLKAKEAPPPPPAPEPEPEPEPEDTPEPEDKAIDLDVTKALLNSIFMDARNA